MNSLSRNALYAPLKDYLNETNTPSANVSNNIREKSLYSFIERISTEFNSPNTSIGVKNGAIHGGRALKSRQVEKILSARSLTLISVVGSSIVKSTDDMIGGTKGNSRKRGSIVRLCGSLSNKKRKRSRKDMKEFVVDSPGVLVGLNQMWSKYILELLSKSSDSKRTTALMVSAELIGAFVHVRQSRACRSYVGKAGFIVDITQNTWKICIAKDGSKDIESMMKCNALKVIILPKRNSTIAVTLPDECKSSELSHLEISGNE